MRGVVLTIVFLLSFTLMFSAALFFFEKVQERERVVNEAKKIDRIGFVVDDVATSLRSFFEISLSTAKNQTHFSAFVSDVLPTSLTNPASALAKYKNFVEGNYSRQTNANVSLNTTRLTTPFVFFEGYSLNYSWNNLTRNEVLAFGASNVKSYFVQGRFSSNCLGESWCGEGGVSWNWVACNANTAYVALDVRDPRNVGVRVANATQGCVSTTSTNTFYVDAVGGGRWTLAVGSVAGYSPAIRFQATPPLQYYSNLTINISQSLPTAAWLPASMTVDGVSIPNLILLEK